LEILRNANDYGLLTGIIIAPVFPPVKGRPDVKADLESIAAELSGIRPDHIYGESLHVRGINLAYLEEALGEKITLNGFDTECEQLFNQTLKDYNLTGRWWREY
jgi:DNA repair photolyase